MGISVNCDSCDTEFSASSKSAGKRVKCPACGEAVRVPLEDDEPVSRRSKTGRASDGRSSSKRGKSDGGNGMAIGLGIGGGVVAILGGLLIFMSRGGGGANVAAPAPAQQAVIAAPTQPVASTNPTVQPIQVVPPANQTPGFGQVAANTNPAPAATPVTPTETLTTNKPTADAAPTDKPNSTETAASSAEMDDNAPLKEMSMTELVAFVERSVVRIIVRGEVGASVGSGFVIDDDGFIMTNYHVIEGAKSAVVEFENGKKANVTGFTTIDQDRDLAIIKIDFDSKLLFKVRVAKELPQKGEKVAAFGAPRGLSFTASDGIISAIRHTPEFNVRADGTYLQTTAPISPGNSGGPLVNMRGEVVGVNSFKIEGENLNFAASSDDIRDVIANRKKELIALSPEALPTKYTDREAGRAENLAGTTRGKILLSQIRDAAILMLPFTFDPTGRVSDYVESQVEKNLIKKAGWSKVTRQSQMKNSTAIVIVLIYFQVAENIEDADRRGVSELMCRVRIIARDVDKDGEAYAAIVWSEDSALGTLAPQALMNGVVTKNIEKKVSEFFGKIVSAYRKARKEVEDGKLDMEKK